MSRSWVRSSGTLAAAMAVLFLAACGSGPRQDASEPNGIFTVSVQRATFPTRQRLSQHTRMVLVVRNDSGKTIPNVAVTILNPRGGTAAQPFGTFIPEQEASALSLASRSRPIWIIDRPPEPPPSQTTNYRACGYSCASGGPGGAVTAYSNTWALGALGPNASARFVWGLTAVKAGIYAVEYQIAAGLNGKAKAVLANGSRPFGTFLVRISGAPQQAYVNNAGQVVNSP